MNSKATGAIKVLVGAVLVAGVMLGVGGGEQAAATHAAVASAATVAPAGDTVTPPDDGSGEGPNTLPNDGSGEGPN
jgi:hypothetical protein